MRDRPVSLDRASYNEPPRKSRPPRVSSSRMPGDVVETRTVTTIPETSAITTSDLPSMSETRIVATTGLPSETRMVPTAREPLSPTSPRQRRLSSGGHFPHGTTAMVVQETRMVRQTTMMVPYKEEFKDERRLVNAQDVMALTFSDDEGDFSHSNVESHKEEGDKKPKKNHRFVGLIFCCLCCLVVILAVAGAFLYTRLDSSDNDDTDIVVVNAPRPSARPTPAPSKPLAYCCFTSTDSSDVCGTCTNRMLENEGFCAESRESCEQCGGTYCDNSDPIAKFDAPTLRPTSGNLGSAPTVEPTTEFLMPTVTPTTVGQKRPIIERNLFEEFYGNYYVNQYYNDNIDFTISKTTDVLTIANLEAMKGIASAVWIDTKERIRAPANNEFDDEIDPTRYFHGIMEVAASSRPYPLVVIVIYNLPNRDCHAYASNGQMCCTYNADGTCDYLNSGNCEAGLAEYKHEYIDPIVDILEEYDSRIAVAAIIEPDSLPNFATNLDDERCGNAGTRLAYTEGIKYAIETIAARTENVAMYVDAAHGAWLGWEHHMDTFVGLIQDMNIEHLIRGFATNVANYQGIGEPCPDYIDCINTHADLALDCCKDPCGLLGEYNPANNEHNYARRLIAAMKVAMPTAEHLHVTIDTGRNGKPDIRQDCGSWCNVRDASIGRIPTYDTLDVETVDSYFWLKTPGESDGCTLLLPSPEDEYVASAVCPRFDQGCAGVDSIGTHVDEPYAPEAGDWFLYQIQMLATDFTEWRDRIEEETPTAIEQRNLFAEHGYYVNPAYATKLNQSISTETDQEIRKNLEEMRGYATAIWIDAKSKIEGTGLDTLQGTLRHAATKSPAPLCVFVLYNLPNRDCSAKASKGELCCAYNLDGTCDFENSGSCTDGLNEYRLDFIDPIAEVLSSYDGIVPVALVIEPSSLSNLIANEDDQNCNNFGTRNVYQEGITYAVQHIATRTDNVAMYLDGGHGGWLGWRDSIQEFVEMVWGMQIHTNLRGFALNTANYQPEGEPCPGFIDCATQGDRDCCYDPCDFLDSANRVGNNEHNYAIALADGMQQWMDDWTHLHVIIDTSRNGEPDARFQCSDWCNIRNARVGRPPSSVTLDEDLVDAYFWIKPPGESDGCTEFLPSTTDPFQSAARCSSFDAKCASIDSVGTRSDEPYAPESGEWFGWHARELSRGLSDDDNEQTLPIVERNLFAENENQYYINPIYVRNMDETIQVAIDRNEDPDLIRSLRKMKGVGSAYWIDVKAKLHGNTTGTLRGILEDSAKIVPPPLTVFIVYDLPNRDCHAYASNGEICCKYFENGRCDYDNSGDCSEGLDEYKHQYIDPYAEILSDYDGHVPIALVIEPDSLPNFATNLNNSRCGNEGTQRAYTEGISYAVKRFAELAPSTSIYLDAAHGAWLGWDDNLVSFVNTVSDLGIHRYLRGFATNVANYQSEGIPCPDDLDCATEPVSTVTSLECCYDPCNILPTYNRANNEHNYARRLVARAELVMSDFHPHVVIDTGRNGNPTARNDCGNWCNARDARVGHIPTADTLDPDIVDAYFWLKTPGESDGCSEYLPSDDDPYTPAETCPRFDKGCASVDSLGTASGEPYVPEAGHWFEYQIIMLGREFDGKIPTPAPTHKMSDEPAGEGSAPSVSPTQPRPTQFVMAPTGDQRAPVAKFGSLSVNGTNIVSEGISVATGDGFCCFASAATVGQDGNNADFCGACTGQALSNEYCGASATNCREACGNANGWCTGETAKSDIKQVQLAGMSLFWSNTDWGGEKFYTSGTVRTLAEDWKCSVVRAAMGVEDVGGYVSDPDANKARVKTVVDAAIDQDIYVIIDFHSHRAENYLAEAQTFFSEMAAEYGSYPHVIFEIYNEPIDTAWSTVTDPDETDPASTIKGYAEAVIPTIREHTNNLILVGTSFYSQSVWEPAIDPLSCDSCTNVAYVFHFYAATHGTYTRSQLKKAVLGPDYVPETGEIAGWDEGENPVRLPVFVSEFGSVEASGDGTPDRASLSRWLEFIDAHKISHLNWAINDKDEGASALVEGADPDGDWFSNTDYTVSGNLARDTILGYRE